MADIVNGWPKNYSIYEWALDEFSNNKQHLIAFVRSLIEELNAKMEEYTNVLPR